MPLAHPAVLARLALHRDDPADADTLLTAWRRRFVSVADLQLRRTVLHEGLNGLDDASLIAVLDRLDLNARGGDAECRWMLSELALNPSVVHELPYARVTELYMAARDAGFRDVAARFLGDRPAVGAPGAENNPHLDLSPGVRTSAARARDRLLIDRLLHDRDPRVIRALLDNPRLVERDAIKIAALRPTAPEVLEAVAQHARWGRNYRVKKALVFNPCTPTSLSRQLLRTLLRQDLLAVRDTGSVGLELRADANLLLTPQTE
ncbi:hypothetical protein LBMAG42_13400 [Deltaproteobacteria bacterium]|nr:hypothetical protein LBMAG42_13400 [Deltaproteobacteria bacterium]